MFSSSRYTKNELLVSTGAIYAFVAYLTAFTLEILFLIDLARQSNEILAGVVASAHSNNNYLDEHYFNLQSGTQRQQPLAANFDRITFESTQMHITVSCLTLAILYFVVFVASLVLIVALILRSTFMLLIWMCAMTTLFVPEFGLVIYVCLYSWTLGTRNGQTELGFYVLRAILNLIFILMAHKLYKQWKSEKTFFRLKTSKHFTGYESPYFIGDSLTTTINPVFSTSTLNLNRYDQIRDANSSPAASNNSPSGFSSSDFGGSGGGAGNRSTGVEKLSQRYLANKTQNQINRAIAKQTSGELLRANKRQLATTSLYSTTGNRLHGNLAVEQQFGAKGNFYLASETADFYNRQHRDMEDFHKKSSNVGSRQVEHSTLSPANQLCRPNSFLSINDEDGDFSGCELDLDYRTLTSQRQRAPSRGLQAAHSRTANDNNMALSNFRGPSRVNLPTSTRATTLSLSPESLSHSTQSLDRQHLREFASPDHVILRPLDHQPFEYLRRPGSTSNLNSIGNLNTQPAYGGFSKRSDYELNYRY